jgi:hypothetical protein
MTGNAAVVYSEEASTVSLLQADGDVPDLRRLVDSLRSLGKVTALNYPATGPVAAALREAGADVVVRQHEMAVPL